MEFPRLVYKSSDKYVLVMRKDEFDAYISEGWYASVPEAVIGQRNKATVKEVIKNDFAQPTREELEQKAKELKLKYDGRIGDAKLASLIYNAIAIAAAGGGGGV